MIEQYYKPRYGIDDDIDSDGQDPTACPACKRIDTTMKASSVARAHRGRFLLQDGTLAAYESELGTLLSRPPRPEALSAGMIASALAVGWFLLALDLAVVAGLQIQSYVSIPAVALETAAYLGLGWFGVLIPGAGVLRYYISVEQVNRALPHWRQDLRRWDTFHYCARDDLVYVPGEGTGVTPEHLGVLYRRAAAPTKAVVALRPREVRA